MLSNDEICVFKCDLALSNDEICVFKYYLALSNDDICVFQYYLALSNDEICVFKCDLALSNDEICVFKYDLALSKVGGIDARSPCVMPFLDGLSDIFKHLPYVDGRTCLITGVDYILVYLIY